MIWPQTGGYHLGGLGWLVVVVVVFVIALIALILASSATARARGAERRARAYSAEMGVGAGGDVPEPVQPASFTILDERYAKGEISRDEYAQRKTDLLKEWKG